MDKHFTIEPLDVEVLSHPENIIRDGGVLLLAKVQDRIVGTCAVVHEGNGHFEVSKTAVTASQQGKGIGRKLVEAAIAAFFEQGGSLLFLETNTVLKSAIALYESLGFQHEPRPTPSPYQRANVYMIYRPKLTK